MADPSSRRRQALLAWYERTRRDLPWRRSRDPYAIWISEAMLQQTRVETVVPYYERFLARFPNVVALASADEQEVLAAWSGLGYYRRARALRRAAAEMVERHGARFPDDRASALALSGVGPYTAGAVLSIAYDLPEPVVDGNVTRVFSRWFALRDPVGSGALNRELWRRAAELLPRRGARPGRGPGAWNQALMELGARVCTPRRPDCGGCPVAAWCAARGSGSAETLPRPAPRRSPVDVWLEVALVLREGALLFERRPPGGRMAGLWELPTRQVEGDGAPLWPAEYRLDLREGPPLGEVSHGITHHRIRARVRWAEVGPGARGAQPGPDRRWLEPASAGDLALTGMARKILRRPFALEHLAARG